MSLCKKKTTTTTTGKLRGIPNSIDRQKKLVQGNDRKEHGSGSHDEPLMKMWEVINDESHSAVERLKMVKLITGKESVKGGGGGTDDVTGRSGHPVRR